MDLKSGKVLFGHSSVEVKLLTVHSGSLEKDEESTSF